MTLYSLALFVHVISDITLFVGIGTQLLALIALRRAAILPQVKTLAQFITMTNHIGVAGALLTIASGLYMTITVWGFRVGWIEIALGSIILVIPPLVIGIVEPRTKALLKTIKELPEGPLPDNLKVRIHDPLLGTALQTNLAVVIGIVFLMTTKPPLVSSLLVMVIALTLGISSGVPLWFASRRQAAMIE